MSRLDDELKIALRREDPSPDFAERVLNRITAPAAAKTGWRDELKMLLQLPRLRWVAVGVTASLMIVAGAIWYQNHQRVEPERNILATNPGAATETPALPAAQVKPEAEKTGAAKSAPEIVSNKAGRNFSRQARASSRRAQTQRAVKDEIEINKQQDSVRAAADGEIAKQQLMLALHIASAKLSEAQKKIQGDD